MCQRASQCPCVWPRPRVCTSQSVSRALCLCSSCGLLWHVRTHRPRGAQGSMCTGLPARCQCVHMGKSFGMHLDIYTGRQVSAHRSACPLCLRICAVSPSGVSRRFPHVCPGHSRFSHSGLACHPRLPFPVGRGHWSEVRLGVRAVRGQKGTMKAKSHRCSRGASGARRSLFSSEARKPLKNVFARIDRPRRQSLGPPMDWEDPLRCSSHVETLQIGRWH